MTLIDEANSEEFEILGFKTAVDNTFNVIQMLLKRVTDTGTEPTHYVSMLAMDNGSLINEFPT